MTSVSYRDASHRDPGAERPAVDGLSLDIDAGEFVVLVGPAGSGTSTALRMLAGLTEITTGSVLIGARDVTDVPARARGVAEIFHSSAVYPHLTVGDNIGSALRIAGVPEPERRRLVQRAADLLDLGDLLDRKPSDLTRAVRQRIAVGRAIVRSPQVLVMDEPMAQLTPEARQSIRDQIAELRDRTGTTTIYATEDPAVAMALGDRVAIMNQGVLQQVDTPQALRANPKNPFVANLIGTADLGLREEPVVVGGSRGVAGDPDRNDDRRVDIAIAEPDPGAYALQVAIGRGLDGSILIDAPPPIASLLPPSSRGWDLDLHLLSADLTVQQNSRRLRLPATGPSEIATFTFRADRTVTRPRARLTVYHEGSAIQSFRLIGRERHRGGFTFTAELDHRQPGGFGYLAVNPGRAVSFTLNESAGRHQLYTVTADGSAVVGYDSGELFACTEPVRAAMSEILETAAFEPGIRQLALRGSELADFLFDAVGEPLRSRIRDVLTTSGETVQVIRIDARQAIPWPAVYDWILPEAPAAAPVCSDPSCSHGDDGTVICLKGFWGVRHSIDETLAERRELPVLSLPVSRASTALLAEYSILTTLQSSQLTKQLAAAYGPQRVRPPAAGRTLLDELWDVPQTPLMMIISHHIRRDRSSSNRADSILSTDSAAHQVLLRASQVTSRAKRSQDLDPPGPTVMLLSCASAKPSPNDLNGFLRALHSAGASAVIGTECTITVPASIAAATAISQALVASSRPSAGHGPASLADAVHAARTELLYGMKDLNGLALTAVGNPLII